MRVNLIALSIVVFAVGILTFSTYQLVNNAQAQVEPTDRYFQKNFCEGEDTILDDIIYSNGDPIRYSSDGCPISTKVIHRWDELSVVRQTLITTRLATQGYADVTDEVNELLER